MGKILAGLQRRKKKTNRMKKYFLLILLVPSIKLTAQPGERSSYWKGELPSNKKTIIAFHIVKDSSGVLTATMDSPGEGMLGTKCNGVTEKGDSIFIQINAIKAVFEGKYKKPASAIEGRWKQGSVIVPLLLTKTDLPVKFNKIKTQTPIPPFPYHSTDVEYDNKDKSVHFGATITRPLPMESAKPTNEQHPAVILISGSGQQNRDGAILGHKPFAVIADFLTRQGYIVLRVDDRKTGKTTGDVKNATSVDFAKDVEASLDFLLQQEEVDKNKIGLIGHSEGGMIAPMVAVQRKEISFLVLLAAPGYPNMEIMADQNESILVQSGYTVESAARYKAFYRKLVAAIITSASDSIALQKGVQYFKEWQKTEKESIVTSLSGVPQTNTPEKFAKVFVSQLSAAWWKFFLKYDPQPTLQKLKIPVLALNGSKDIQVMPRSLQYIKKALQQSGSKKYNVEEMPELNHLFQQCYYCTTAEYAQLEESFSPKALEKIGEWLQRVIK
jgi:uncharacterized protein